MKTDDSELRQRIEALEALVGRGTPPPTPTSLRERLYARASRAVHVSGPERLVRTQCNDAEDIALSCGGPIDGSIPITRIGVLRATGPRRTGAWW